MSRKRPHHTRTPNHLTQLSVKHKQNNQTITIHYFFPAADVLISISSISFDVSLSLLSWHDPDCSYLTILSL